MTGPDNYRFGGAEGRPTPGADARLRDLLERWAGPRERFRALLETDVLAFNALLAQLSVPGVIVPAERR